MRINLSTQRRVRSATTVIGIGYLVVMLLWLSFLGAVIWVAWHFISKYW